LCNRKHDDKNSERRKKKKKEEVCLEMGPQKEERERWFWRWPKQRTKVHDQISRREEVEGNEVISRHEQCMGTKPPRHGET